MTHEIIAITIWSIIMLFGLYFVYHFINLLFIPQKKAPYIPTFDSQLKIMEQLNLKKWATIVDLWCWDGKALRFFSKTFKSKICDWFDINSFAILKWKHINKKEWFTNINLQRKNMFEADLSKYDYIYVYLRDSQLKIIEDWIRKEKKDNTIIIANTFEFSKHTPFQTFKNTHGTNTIFLYK